jgi:hypothetical protein
MTRLWTKGEPITVAINGAGEPLRFSWRGEMHPVTAVVRRWRADADWWKGRIWREHFKLVTDTGVLAVVYHDLVGHEWYLQRVYD